MAELGGMLAAAILKVVGEQIASVIKGQITLQKNFDKDMEKMKMALESVEAVLEDAERRSISEASVRLWLKRLKDAMYAISDMIDEFEADTQVAQHSARKFPLKKHLLQLVPCFPAARQTTMANEIKMMREKLKDITDQHQSFTLTAGTSANELHAIDIRETSSTMGDEAQIVGRINEKEKILASLSESRTKEFTILPIYGIGGLGKTTLAKIVFNNSQFRDYSQVWIYVSQTFNLKKIGNSIISQLSKGESQYTEMQMIHNFLREQLADKKILIVLDDLWEDNRSQLEELKAMLKVGGATKVVVIVTTRCEGIANNICTVQPHKLALLTDDMCWTIIKQKSGFKSRDGQEELEQVGKDIAMKCRGVVLAAQSLGHMLQSMTSGEWRSVRNSDIWSVSSSDDSPSTQVIASLRLSYSFMPSYLKLCFAYCAIFPKGHRIIKDDLIHHWIFLGFIKATNMLSTWQLGERYIRQLVGLSFLEHSKSASTAEVYFENFTLLTMHDLVHDLAKSVMVDEILFAGKHGRTGGNCHYALLSDCSKPLESSKIRALRFMDCGKIQLHDAAFSSAKSLRVLDLSECSIHKLPDSIGVLKQLRYLNAPGVQDTMIPNGITGLSKLVYLNLRGSSSILALPASIGEIEGLMYLDLSGCLKLEELPESLARLKKLVHLDLSNCSSVEDVSKFFGSLRELQHLDLSYCKSIGELPQTLGGLSELQYLNLSFSSYIECCQELEVLGALTKLEYLDLSSERCDLQKLPEAFGRFVELKYLNLSGCHHIVELPTLFGNLKNLGHLDLSNCAELNAVPEALSGLTKIQYLNLSRIRQGSMQRLRGMEEVIGNLTNLRYLNLSRCMTSIFGNYTSKISEGQFDNFIYRITTLSNLEHLDLSYSYDISTLPQSLCNLRKLHTLDLSYCRDLEEIPESISTIDSLKFLYLNGCHVMSELPQLSRNSITLPRFVVHAGDVSSNLVLLQHTDPAKLHIFRLENVRSAEEAQHIRLVEKQTLTELKLVWGDAERFVDDKILLEELVTPSTLKKLDIQGYNIASFPAWLMDITHYLPNLVSIKMCEMPNCKSLPPIHQLPKLTHLVLSGMERLEEWNTSYSSDEEYVIEELTIRDCPKLRLKPVPPRAIRLKISNSDIVLSSWGECTMPHTSASSSPVTVELQVENSKVPLHQWKLLNHLHGLTYFSISDCHDLTGSPEIFQHLSSLETLILEGNYQEELPEWLGELTSLQKLIIMRYPGLKALPDNMRQLTKLQSLNLYRCNNMASLPHWLGELISLKILDIWGPNDMRSLPESIRRLTDLQELSVCACPELKHLVESENKMKLAHIKEGVCVLPTSLKRLVIRGCDGIRSLPDIQQLTILQKLEISSCLELRQWCESEENEMKLAHIKEKEIRS